MGMYSMLFVDIVDNARFLLMDFIRNLAICNTVMLMPNTLTGELNVTDKESLKEVLEVRTAYDTNTV